MKRALGVVGVAALLSGVAFGQSADPLPAFALADIHVSPRSATPAVRVSSRAGRYEIRNATMVDLIRTAYTIDADKVLGGPNWLEYDRFDIAALVPPNTTPDSQKLMLRSLLADRFKLAVRADTKPAAGHALVMGKGNHKLKEAADSTAAPGCQTKTVPPRPPSGVPGQFALPMTGLACHGVTMATFAADLKRLANGYVTNAVLDQTGLKGSWDLELQFTQWALLGLAKSADGATATSLSDAIDKQLGLKLEERDIPTPVIVVERVNAAPTPNAPDVAAKLPPLPPLEFEVADIKPVDPNVPLTGPIQFGVSPGGRVNLPGRVLSLKALVALAWNLPGNTNGEIIGAPKWLDTARFDVIAKLPSDLVPAGGLPPLQELGPALQALLVERFKMKVHFEDRPVDAYTLIAVKPKLKKADPSTRTGCKAPANSGIVFSVTAGMPARAFNCQNITMAQFADQLQTIAGAYLFYPVIDGTGLEGAWDFALSFSPIAPQQFASMMAGARAAAPAGGAGGPTDVTASDPIGGGASLFDAVEKQLGLKLEVRKRTYPVFVIDHIEEKPTEN